MLVGMDVLGTHNLCYTYNIGAKTNDKCLHHLILVEMYDYWHSTCKTLLHCDDF